MANRIVILSSVLTTIAVVAGAAWLAGSRIESPADVAARTAPPKPSPILVPVERRVLSASIITRGSARYGLPQPISIAPSALKPQGTVITTLPLPNAQFSEGDILLNTSGRPVFVFQGQLPVYRDLGPGIRGEDVLQLERALKRLGYDPGPIDGTYDARTSAAVARWYQAKGSEPFGPTKEQVAALRTLERDWADATKLEQSTAAAVQAAAPALEAARATAESMIGVARADASAKIAERERLEKQLRDDAKLTVESEQSKAKHAAAAAEADLATAMYERALIELDPRQSEAARASANAKLDVARANVERTKIAGQVAVHAAQRAAAGVNQKLMQAAGAAVAARLAERSARLEGEKTVRLAANALKLAELDAKVAGNRARQLTAELEAMRAKLGVQVPADELVFLRSLPVRVQELKATVGAQAAGVVMMVTDNELSIDSSLSLESAPLVKAGMPVTIDEPSLGIKATGVVESVATTPGTRGVDGLHFYAGIKVDATPAKLAGFSVRLTIPIKSTQGAVTAVPTSALSLAADGSSRVQVKRGAVFEYIAVTPGLSADGYVEVAPANGAKLDAGDMVVVGYNNAKAEPENAASMAEDGKAPIAASDGSAAAGGNGRDTSDQNAQAQEPK